MGRLFGGRRQLLNNRAKRERRCQVTAVFAAPPPMPRVVNFIADRGAAFAPSCMRAGRCGKLSIGVLVDYTRGHDQVGTYALRLG